MKIAITGASGLLGRSLLREFVQNQSFDVQGYAYSRAKRPLLAMDLTNMSAVCDVLHDFKPDIIIHAAAHRQPDVCENDHVATDALNVLSTKNLVSIANELGAWLLYVSTDYVFDGTAAPYAVDDVPNPLNYYGQSKLAGERELAACKHGSVLRVPVLYGEVESLAESAITVIAEAVLAGEAKKVDHWAVRYPTLVSDIADACLQLCELLSEKNVLKMPPTLHFSASEASTKYEQALVMADILGVSGDHLTGDEQEPAGAPRPHDCALDCSVLAGLINMRQTSLRDGLSKVLSVYCL